MFINKQNFPLFFFLFFLFALCANSVKGQQVFINEFLASNSTVNEDEFNEHDDWIELYNPGTATVNLGGMYLSDNLNNLTKWQIPQGVNIGADGYQLFWCDDQQTQGNTHTSFKLSAGGEDLVLTAADGTTIIDSYTYGQQTANSSVGREDDGSATWVFFSTPSPNSPNGATGTTLAEKPVASLIGGHYNNDITVSLSTTTPNGTIRYTTDGTIPSSSSSSYNNPIEIDETTVLRARTFNNNFAPSRTMTHTYMYGIDHDFVIICISTDTANIFGAANGIYPNWTEDIEHEVHAELFEPDGTFGFGQDLGIQIFGGYSQTYDHKSLSLTARSEYGANKINYPLFPDQEFTEYGALVLRSSGLDWKRTMFRDAVASGLMREFDDVDAMIKDPDMELQAYRPAVVYINGDYFGIHNLREKMDWRYLDTHFGVDKDDVDILQKEQNVDQGDTIAWGAFYAFTQVANFNNANDLATLKTWIDLDHFTDYFLAEIFLDNNDWPGNNNRRWRVREAGEKWRYFLYDLDRGLGLLPLNDEFNSGDWNSPSLNYVTEVPATMDWNPEWSTLLLRKLLENEDFRIKFINRMADQLNIIFPEERIVSRLDEYSELYAPEIPQHADKWWSNNNWESDVNKMYLFADGRTDFMWQHFNEFFSDIHDVADIQLNAQPAAGGEIHLNTMNFSEVNFPWFGQYFEGLDVPLYTIPNPGYFFTGWSPSNLGNNPTTSINFNGNETITANFILGSTDTGNVIINEINYHSPDTCDAGDWVELYNADDTAIDVSGWYLDDGGAYFTIPMNTVIPAHGYLVIVENPAQFQNIHPQVNNFVGGFGTNSITGNFSLSNSGEWFGIKNANNTYRDTLRYQDNLPWPAEADRNGATLQLINHNLDNALPQSWAASPIAKGTPGTGTQGVLELGSNSFSCLPNNLILDASFSPCYACNYAWSNGANTATITVNTTAGNNSFSVTVTDAIGTTQTDEINIMIADPIDVQATVQNTTCFDSNNGSIALEANGSSTYTYAWSNGLNGSSITSLSPNTYQVTVSDNNNCTTTESYAISAPTEVMASVTTTDISCFNGNDGSVLINPSGGTGDFNYQWNNGLSGNNPSNIMAGDYSVTISDENNCSLVESISLTQPLALEITNLVQVQNSCFGESQGQISLESTGGTAAVSYLWSNGAVQNNIDNLAPGNYSVTLTDNNMCTFNQSFTITAPSEIELTPTITNVDCNDEATGVIELNISGGTSGYQILWSNGLSSSTINNLSAGSYSVTVTDAMNCQQEGNYSISQSTNISIESNLNSVSCFGESNGNIDLSISGANGPYSFSWNTSDTEEDLTNIPAGNYTVTITDQNDCISIENYAINQPDLLEATFNQVDNLCHGESNGSITTTVLGGTSPYNYLWSNGAQSQSIQDLPAENYTLTITDNNMCTFTESIEISSAGIITADWTAQSPTCPFGNDGTIDLVVDGGSGNYSFLWSNNGTTSFISNLAASDYNVTITDDNNCSLIVGPITVPEAPIIIFENLSVIPISCGGQFPGNISFDAIGGNGPLTYLWSTGETSNEIITTEEGIYFVTVTDNFQCSTINSFTIQMTDGLFLESNVTNISCAVEQDGSIAVVASGGNQQYTYNWSNGATTPNINALNTGDYTLTVSDSDGCTAEETYYITAPAPLGADAVGTDPTLGDNGSILVIPWGGSSPDYTILWNTGSTDFELENLPGGTYIYVITDGNGCTFEGTVDLDILILDGLDELNEIDLTIFPNPSNGLFYIQSEIDAVTVDIVDLLGRTIMTRKLSLDTKESDHIWPLNLLNLEDGVYFLKFSTLDSAKLQHEAISIERIVIFSK